MLVEVTSRSLTRGTASPIVHQRVRIGADVATQEEPQGFVAGGFWQMASIAGTVGGAYHGWKRTGSVGWTIGWTLLGGMFPLPTMAVAVAQGFGKKP